MAMTDLLLLGGPNSGKTHYAGQLYGRLRRRPGRLVLRKQDGTPTDLGPLEEVLESLENGRAAHHTATKTWAEVQLPLADRSGRSLELTWPDYGGEQLREIEKQRVVSEAWRARLSQADGWVILLRLQAEKTYPDALAQLTTLAGRAMANEARTKQGGWDANARWVELLQILLHVAGHGTVQRRSRPRLAILLSCYDELEAGTRPPAHVLADRLPLLAAFVGSSWSSESVSIWGLSALGRLLDTSSRDDDFINEGPELHGWVMPPEGGERDPDLSSPLAWLLEAP